ncbi:MAG: polysulfide reductase NrfD [Solirubrobacterales bacterium]|nr:polysulfide reductase NrfD [Solirubrobacterales bacterium]
MSVDDGRAATWEGNPVRSYHEQPVLKKPIWTWEIPTYFFTGGLGGASAGLAQLAELQGNGVLAHRAWTTAAAAAAVSPTLLISDLGRPKRFLNMLRMFKVSSPMSVGSWILVAAGTCNATVTLNAWTGALPRLRQIAAPAGALLGLPMSTYTAALVANTAVPAWHEARRELPFVFASGAALSAGAAALITTPPAYAAPARRLALGAVVCEMVSSMMMEHRLGEHARPYKEGLAGKLGWARRLSMVAGAAMLHRRGESSHPAAAGAGSMLLAGALTKRWQVFRAGVQSATDPGNVIGPQRAAVERGEGHGAVRR